METILLATDLSEEARTATQTALRLSEKLGAKLVLYNSFVMIQPAGGNRHAYQKRLEQEKEARKEQLTELVTDYLEEHTAEPPSTEPPTAVQTEEKQALDLEYVISHEPPDKQLKQLLDEYEVDLMVVPPAHLNDIVGKKLDTLINELPCPLLKVPDSEEEVRFDTLVYTTDFGRPEQTVLPLLSTFIAHFESSIKCLHIRTPKERDAMHVQRNMEDIKLLMEHSLEVEVDMALVSGDSAASGIEKYVETHKVDVLIMRTRTHSFIERAFQPKTVVQKVSGHINIPVLILKD